MDKSWINLPRNTHEYKCGLNCFLDFASEHQSVEGRIICPCPKCKFKIWKTREVVYDHLIFKLNCFLAKLFIGSSRAVVDTSRVSVGPPRAIVGPSRSDFGPSIAATVTTIASIVAVVISEPVVVTSRVAYGPSGASTGTSRAAADPSAPTVDHSAPTADPSAPVVDPFSADPSRPRKSVKRKSLNYWTVEVIDEEGVKIEQHMRAMDAWTLSQGKKIVTPIDRFGEPIQESRGLLGQFLGSLTSQFYLLPISYHSWNKMPKSIREDVYHNTIQKMCLQNTNNRSKLTIPHTGGSKSISQRRHEEENEAGHDFSRGMLYDVLHKKKDGSYINEEAKNKAEKILQDETKGCPTELSGCTKDSSCCGSSLGSSAVSKMTLTKELEKRDREIEDLKGVFSQLYQLHGVQVPYQYKNQNNISVSDAASGESPRHFSSGSHEPNS